MHNRYRHGRYEAYFEPSFYLAIFGVCRLVSREAISIFYEENIFWFECEPLGPAKIHLKVSNSKYGYKGMKFQQKLIGGCIKSLTHLTPSLVRRVLCFDSTSNLWSGRVQHMGLVLPFERFGEDRFGELPSSSVSLSSLLRDLALSGVSLRTARLEIRFSDAYPLKAFEGSNLMKAAQALIVKERIVVTASGVVDEEFGSFAHTLAGSKGWKVATTINNYGMDKTTADPIVLGEPDEARVDYESFVESIGRSFVWQLTPSGGE